MTFTKKIEFVLLDERWISKFKKCLACKMKIFIQFKLHWLDSNSKKENRMPGGYATLTFWLDEKSSNMSLIDNQNILTQNPSCL